MSIRDCWFVGWFGVAILLDSLTSWLQATPFLTSDILSRISITYPQTNYYQTGPFFLRQTLKLSGPKCNNGITMVSQELESVMECLGLAKLLVIFLPIEINLEDS